MLINIYLPCQSSDSEPVITSIFAALSDVVNLYPNHKVLLGGYLDTDLRNNKSSTTIFMLKFILIWLNEME